jgi:hypothetical protein
MLFNIGEDSSLIGSRRGLLTRNATPVTGSPGIIGGFQFKKSNGTKQTLLVSDTGRLDQLNTDDTLTVLNATAFTSGVHYPVFAVARDFCFIVNDVNQKKFDGTTLSAFGITRPAAPTAAAAAGGAMAAGVWDVALTYYNSASGNESSLSDFTSATLAAGNLRINASWSAPADAQVTHVRVYIRQQSAGSNVYRMVAGATPAPDATTGGFPVATLSTVIDISASQYSAFTILAPSTTENNPPPSGTQFPVWHFNRMFLADSGNIYYSNIKQNAPFPEAFNPDNTEPVNPNDGDTITGMLSAFGKLFIFKKFSIYYLEGSDNASWQIKLLTKDFGLSTMRSIVSAGGSVHWWSGATGPAAMNPDGQPFSLGKALLSNSISASELNHQAFASVSGGLDELNELVVWSVPEAGSSRNTRIVPFNYRLKRFVAEWWNPMDIYSLWSMETTAFLQTPYGGGYAGQVFQLNAASNDGVPSGTASGTVTASGNTTLTDSTAAFVTTGGGLIERYVYAISQDRLTIQRRRITANTATQLTVTPAWSNNPNTTYTYVIGGVDFQLDTPWMPGPSVFIKKRYEFLFVEASTTQANIVFDVDLFTSMFEDSPKVTKSLTLSVGGAVYDAATSLFDTSLYAGSSMSFGKLRCGCTGKLWRARLRNLQKDSDVLLRKVSMQSIPMGINT